MHEIDIYKGWLLYRAEFVIPKEQQRHYFYSLTRRGAVRAAQKYLAKLTEQRQGYIETIYYEPGGNNGLDGNTIRKGVDR